MNFLVEEQIGSFKSIQFYLLSETSSWPKIITDANSNKIIFTEGTDPIEITPIGENQSIKENPKKNPAGIYYNVDGGLTFQSHSKALAQQLDVYQDRDCVIIVDYFTGERKLFGTNTHPLRFLYNMLSGKKMEDFTGINISLKGKTTHRAVYL